MWFSLESQTNGLLSPLRLASMEMDWNRELFFQFLSGIDHEVGTPAFPYLRSLHVSTGALCASEKTLSCSQKRTTRWLASSCRGLSMKRRVWMRSVAVMKCLETIFVRYALATHHTFISKCTLNMCLDTHTCVFMLVCVLSVCVNSTPCSLLSSETCWNFTAAYLNNAVNPWTNTKNGTKTDSTAKCKLFNIKI